MDKVDKRSKAYRKYNRPEELLKTAKERYTIMAEDDRHNREDAIEDIRFVNLPGAQWSENMKRERGDRPCYEYNFTRVRCKRVVNDMRDNRPFGKVLPTEGGDKEMAEIYEGLIRNIWGVGSCGDNATDYAAEYQVEGGMGAWRINTAYSSDTAFDQDITIERIENPLALYADPQAADAMKRDARDWIYTTRIPHDEFEVLYGEEAQKADFEVNDEFEDSNDDEWTDEETVRIAEYWYKVPVKKELWLVEQQSEEGEMKRIVVDSESDEAAGIDPALIVDTREIDTHKIMMFIASGMEILEGPVEWAGRHFPWIMVHGEHKIIEGRQYWWGIVRFAKDAQRSLNVSKTAIAETIAQSPKAKWWATSAQAAGHSNEWAEADFKNFPYLLYEADPAAPGPPMRMGAADVPIALMQQSAMDNEALKDVMGLPDASMGAEGGEKSGRAIYARQQQGEIATFNFRDNMTKGVEYTMELLIDLIPEVYDTERELRILGQDGAESYKRINQMVQDPATGKAIRVNDMSMGKYDVTVTSGPSFATKRQEASEMYSGLLQAQPEIMGIAGDLIMKAYDLPYADEIAERLKSMLPPQIQQMMNDETEVPPEVQQMMQQAQQAMQQVQEYGQLVQAASQELEGEKAVNDKEKAEIQTALAKLKQAEAEFETKIAKEMSALVMEKAGLSQKEAGLVMKEAGLTIKGAEVKEAAVSANIAMDDRDNSALEVTGRVDDILANFMQQADAAFGELSSKAQSLQKRVDRKPVGGITKREGGKLTANVQYDDGSEESLSAVRDAGGLKIVPNE